MENNVYLIQSADGTMVDRAPEETHLFVSRSEEDEGAEQQAGDYDLSDEEAAADSSYSSASSQNSPREAYSTTHQWPQSYKKSMDIYSNVVSPSFGFFSPTVKLSSPVLSYRLKGTPGSNEKATLLSESLCVPLLQENAKDIQLNHELISGPPLHNGKSLQKIDLKETLQPQRDYHAECHIPKKGCSFMQATVNGINVLAGVGVLSTPYALKQGGWISLMVLLFFALICCYTGILLRQCLESKPGLTTYPDIGGAAFGNTGRLIVSMILYTELYACSVEFLILEGDNLSLLFPGVHLHIFGYHMESQKVFAVLAAVLVLPTVWLRDLSLLSYLSAGGVIASVVIVLAVFWVGAVDGIGFHNHGRFADLANLPMSVGLFGFCYSGHAVFPDIYSSMKNPTQFNRVLQVSFVVCTIMYGGVGVLGYRMFGQETKSQVTLNLPETLLASQIAIWTTVINPLTKYALTITPVALSLEELVPNDYTLRNHWASIMIRTALVTSTLLVALVVPYFGLVMALIGSFLSVTGSLILPCACFWFIQGSKLSIYQGALCIAILITGVLAAIAGTYYSASEILSNFMA